jgi:hypothetical protein
MIKEELQPVFGPTFEAQPEASPQNTYAASRTARFEGIQNLVFGQFPVLPLLEVLLQLSLIRICFLRARMYSTLRG